MHQFCRVLTSRYLPSAGKSVDFSLNTTIFQIKNKYRLKFMRLLLLLKADWPHQRNHDEGGSRDGGTHVGPDAAAVQDAHSPGELALEQGAHLGVEHDLEVTLHNRHTALYCTS